MGAECGVSFEQRAAPAVDLVNRDRPGCLSNHDLAIGGSDQAATLQHRDQCVHRALVGRTHRQAFVEHGASDAAAGPPEHARHLELPQQRPFRELLQLVEAASVVSRRRGARPAGLCPDVTVHTTDDRWHGTGQHGAGGHRRDAECAERRRGALDHADLRQRAGHHVEHRAHPLVHVDRMQAVAGHLAAVVGAGDVADAAPVAPVDAVGRHRSRLVQLPCERVLERASGRVVRLARVAGQSDARREEEDQVEGIVRGRLSQHQAAARLDIEYPPQRLGVEVRQRPIVTHERAVDDAVDRTETLVRPGHRGTDGAWVGDVGLNIECAAARLLDAVERPSDVIVGVASTEQDDPRGDRVREPDRELDAEATRAPGQEVDAVAAERGGQARGQGHWLEPAPIAPPAPDPHDGPCLAVLQHQREILVAQHARARCELHVDCRDTRPRVLARQRERQSEGLAARRLYDVAARDVVNPVGQHLDGDGTLQKCMPFERLDKLEPRAARTLLRR